MRQWSRAAQSAGLSIGFVPTMGALHAGHAHLLGTSVDHNDRTVLSIFVNPTQFNQSADYATYPRTWDPDIDLARSLGVDAVFAPPVEEMYPGNGSTRVVPGPIASILEGVHRPGHFEGVATIVVKLLNAVRPDRAYFGLKDFQQVAVVRSVVQDLDVPVEIVALDTVRDDDGLALSSRNTRLSPDDRAAARVIHRALSAGMHTHAQGSRDAAHIRGAVAAELSAEPRCRVEYIEVADSRTLAPVSRISSPSVLLVAAWFADVRLIDNVQLPS